MKNQLWVITIAGTLFAIISGVFLVGWNLRGQTAQIIAVEVKTDTLRNDFGKHEIEQVKTIDEMDSSLDRLLRASSEQTTAIKVLAEKINK